MKKTLITLATAAILTSGCELVDTATVGTRYVAKMTCSCVFVSERDIDVCVADLPDAVGSVNISHDEERRQIKASVVWVFRATAEHEEGKGCKIAG